MTSDSFFGYALLPPPWVRSRSYERDVDSAGALPGQSIYQIDGLHLYEPYLKWCDHRPACACDEPLSGWTFMDTRMVDVWTEEVFCRKCGAVGGQFPVVEPECC